MKLSYKRIELALAKKKMNFEDLQSVPTTIGKYIKEGADFEPKAVGKLADELGVEVETLVYSWVDEYPEI